jgi:cytochrome P450
MRFGLLELKMTLAKLIRRFDILPPHGDWSGQLKFSEGVGVRRPAEHIRGIFKSRQLAQN